MPCHALSLSLSLSLSLHPTLYLLLGGLINKHPGNIAYRRVVDFNKAIYKRVPKRHRILVSRSIVQTIQNHGGRFLQQQQATRSTSTSTTTQNDYVLDNKKKKKTASDIVWVCIPVRRAVQKTSQALREPVVVTVVQQQRQQSNSLPSPSPQQDDDPMV
jgi:hypothetical protein